MKLEDQCTTIKQSRRLLELGVNKDTASLKWYKMATGEWEINNRSYVVSLDEVPCWTIADMMKLIHSYRGFSINILGQVEIYSLYEPSKDVVGKEVTIRDDYSILRDNLFEALVLIEENKYL